MTNPVKKSSLPAGPDWSVFEGPPRQRFCPTCGCYPPHKVRPGRGPHYAEVRCARCGRHLQWLSRDAVAEMQS